MMCLRKGNSWGENKHKINKIVEKKTMGFGRNFQGGFAYFKNDQFMNKCILNGY